MSAPRLAVTGATGFLGRAVVEAARAAGAAVVAIARDPARFDGEAWRDDPAVRRVAADLAEAAPPLDDVSAVIHAAASLGGDDAAQARDTVRATERLIEAMATMAAPPRLVLVSSLAVYNYASLPDGATLDETTPLEPEPALRDAYCRGKLAQEALAVAAAQRRGLDVRILRPGAILGPGRMRTARLGVALGPLLLMPGGAATIPAVAAADCAAAAVAAATAPRGRSDAPIPQGGGHVEAINLVGADLPDQRAHAAALAAAEGWPRRVIRLPLGPLRAVGGIVALAGVALPGLPRRLPGLMRVETFEARFKPLRYSNARLRERLGVEPGPGLRPASPETAR